MKAGGLLAILEKPKKGESDDTDEAPESADMGSEKKDAMRDFLDAIKADDVDAATLAAERFVMCCHDEE